MSAHLTESGAPRCSECGMPTSMHHDPGCGQPCGACKRAGRRRLWRELAFVLGCGAGGLLGDWVFSGSAHLLTWPLGLVTGCLAAMGRQRWMERRR